eukprot:TRINITY_DN4769_c0_g1_i4.p1 TRINITY_DN4769_c0_g1~~TRINITY_DN4769_c0_g1_i4.p1  ORF type:complete len:683 (+),score=140.34 TRINITY_DN4769_c0_g1_i4:3314-5362(+)
MFRAAGVVCLLVASTVGVLTPRSRPLPVGNVRPKGWLLRQLVLQSEGLSGHLSMFWPDIQHSSWIGGAADLGLHERVPYWLNGVVPLAALLEAAGVKRVPETDHGDHSHGHRHAYSSAQAKNASVDIALQVDRYIGYILDHQGANGWLGPDDHASDPGQYWGPTNVLQALTMWAEWKDDGTRTTKEWTRAASAVLRHVLLCGKRLPNTGMNSWAQVRWQDLALVVEWLLDNAPQGMEAELTALLTTLRAAGEDWEAFFESPDLTAPNGLTRHNVNLAQGLKTAAVRARFEPGGTGHGNYTWADLSARRMKKLDALNGLPTGMFNGDEYLPTNNSRHPSRGIELCGVVEAMYSYNLMYSVHGNTAFADRAELVAFNALPATWASPRGGDMWAHQYLQAVNEINAKIVPDHLWETDGPASEMYGLEPNFGCCTANFNQGWPKFASHAFYTTADGAVVVALLVPAAGTTPAGDVVDVDTDYPFRDDVTITVAPGPKRARVDVLIRIPGWADAATLDGVLVRANGTHVKKTVTQATTFHLALNPTVRVSEWFNGAVAVRRGALLYSLPIKAAFTLYQTHYADSNDYFADPASPWGFALDVNLTLPAASLQFVTFDDGSPAPWNHTAWAVGIEATVRPVPWGVVKNSADAPPASPACVTGKCGAPLHVLLVPHGGTDLRMGELPRSY